MADEVDLRRVEYIMFLTSVGRDPGLTTWAERVTVKAFVEQAVANWQAAGVLPRTPDPLDLTPTDVQNRYRRWAELERLRLDPAIPWQQGQTLAALGLGFGLGLARAAADALDDLGLGLALLGLALVRGRQYLADDGRVDVGEPRLQFGQGLAGLAAGDDVGADGLGQVLDQRDADDLRASGPATPAEPWWWRSWLPPSSPVPREPDRSY